MGAFEPMLICAGVKGHPGPYLDRVEDRIHGREVHGLPTRKALRQPGSTLVPQSSPQGQIHFDYDSATRRIRINLFAPLCAGDRTMLVGVGLDQAGVHRKAFTVDEASRNAWPDDGLEHVTEIS
jgi:hypothetical protein